MKIKYGFLGVLCLVCAAMPCRAQTAAVAVGKGSYADGVPAQVDEKIRKFEKRDLFLVKEDDRPIPTNKWWTDLIVSRFAKALWAYPMKVDASERGVDIFLPTRWSNGGNDPVSEFPLGVGGRILRRPTRGRRIGAIGR